MSFYGLVILILFAIFFVIVRHAVRRTLRTISPNSPTPHYSPAEASVNKVKEILTGARRPPMNPSLDPTTVDVFVSGHTHLPSLSELERPDGRRCALVNSGCYLRQLQPVSPHLKGPPVFVSKFVLTHVRVFAGDEDLRVELWEQPKPAHQSLTRIERLLSSGRRPPQPPPDSKPRLLASATYERGSDTPRTRGVGGDRCTTLPVFVTDLLLLRRRGGRSGGGNERMRSKESNLAASGPKAPGTAKDAGQPEPPVALVPIAHLGSTLENVSTKDLSKARGLAVARTSRGEAGELVGRSEFESFDSPDAVVDHVSTTPGALGLVPWDEVGPGGQSPVGGRRVAPRPGSFRRRKLSPQAGRRDGARSRKLRRVVVGGDIVLDRGQNYMVIQKGMGVDFPLDGGYAAVTSRVPEPSAYSETGIIHQFTAERTGGAGEVREYLAGADLTLANFENPVIRDAVWHPDATTFTGDLRLMPVLDQAGIDGLTLGNNHILDAGTTGLDETMSHLDDAGIAHAGAGMDLEEARKPMVFDLGGTRVGVLSYLGVPSYDWAWATRTAPGTAPLLQDVMEEDIKRLREKVDLILVMPHWGVEYTATPEPEQVDLAHAAIDAGPTSSSAATPTGPRGSRCTTESPSTTASVTSSSTSPGPKRPRPVSSRRSRCTKTT